MLGAIASAHLSEQSVGDNKSPYLEKRSQDEHEPFQAQSRSIETARSQP